MAGLGSWARFIIGILLALEVVKQWIFGNPLSKFGNTMAVLFLSMTVLYFVTKI